MPKEGYLQKMRELCDKYEILLIFDEIITGFRMGLGGAQKEFGVTPDITTLGKAIAGGGVPVSAMVGKKEVMQLLVDKKVIHAGTFNGYPLGTAAVKATLSILSREDGSCYSRTEEKISRIHKIFTDKAKEAGMPLIVQGPLFCGAFHCCEEELICPSQYDNDIMSRDIILNACMERNGILASSMSRLYPNVMLDNSDVEWFEEHIGGAISEAQEIFEEIY